MWCVGVSRGCGCTGSSSGLSMMQQQSEEREKRSEWIGGGNIVGPGGWREI